MNQEKHADELCIECGGNLFSDANDKNWWHTEGLARNLALPRRCASCRRGKRQRFVQYEADESSR